MIWGLLFLASIVLQKKNSCLKVPDHKMEALTDHLRILQGSMDLSHILTNVVGWVFSFFPQDASKRLKFVEESQESYKSLQMSGQIVSCNSFAQRAAGSLAMVPCTAVNPRFQDSRVFLTRGNFNLATLLESVQFSWGKYIILPVDITKLCN